MQAGGRSARITTNFDASEREEVTDLTAKLNTVVHAAIDKVI